MWDEVVRPDDAALRAGFSETSGQRCGGFIQSSSASAGCRPIIRCRRWSSLLVAALVADFASGSLSFAVC